MGSGVGEIQHILLITEDVVNKFFMNFVKGGMGCLTSNKSVSFSADLDHELHSGF